MVRILRLNQDFTRQISPTGPPSDLHELGEQPFRRAPVGGKQRAVGTEHADQRQFREIVPLGQHLRTDENVGLAVVDLFDQHLPLLAALGRIAVGAQDARVGEARGEGFFEPLRATPEG